MTELRRLSPHDPVPDEGSYMLVLRRFGEDAPRVAVVELITAAENESPQLTVLVRPDGTPMGFEEAVEAALARAERDGFAVVYALDRTAGVREHEVLVHGGDRTVGMEQLVDTDPEDGEQGTDIRDRPANAGSNLTPRR
jgi:hypothetical protein